MGRSRYKRVNWKPGNAGLTAMSPTNFNVMDKQVDGLDIDLDSAEDRLDAIEAALDAESGYTHGTEFPPPTLGSPAFFDLDDHKLYMPAGDAWYNAGTGAVATGPGAANAPQNFSAEVNPDNTISLDWATVGGASAITVREKFTAPGGLPGMPLAGGATSYTVPASSTPATREFYVTGTVSGVESAQSRHVTVYLPYGAGPATGGGTTGVGTVPMSFLGIGSGYYANLGIGLPSGHVNIPYPELAGGYTKGGYVELNTAGDGVVLTSYMNGKTTSDKTHYARNESREQDSHGANVYFDATDGTHSWEYVFGIGHIQPNKPWVTAGQIHDRKSDSMSIKMKGAVGTGGASRTSLDIVAAFYDTDHPTKLLTGYDATQGVDAADQVTIKVVLRDGGVVDLYCNGVLKITSNAIKDKIAADSTYRDIYWKLGLYPQAHSEYTSGSQPKEDPKEYCRGVFYSHDVSHSPSLG